jgi:hypothetical protein
MGLNTNDFNSIRTYHKVNKNTSDPEIKQQADALNQLNLMFKQQTDNKDKDLDQNVNKKGKRRDHSQKDDDDNNDYL